MNLALATTLYTLAEKASIEIHCVSYAGLKAFALQLKAFERNLGEDKHDDYWQPKLRSLKGYRFRLCAAPLPFDDPDKRYAERFKHLERELTNCHNIYPQFAAQAQELVKQACAPGYCRANAVVPRLHSDRALGAAFTYRSLQIRGRWLAATGSFCASKGCSSTNHQAC